MPFKCILPYFQIFLHNNYDGFVKSRNSIECVIPAKAGIQLFQDVLDPGFRRGDDPRDFFRDHYEMAIMNKCSKGKSFPCEREWIPGNKLTN